jgi:site-specific recombinase XerC
MPFDHPRYLKEKKVINMNNYLPQIPSALEPRPKKSEFPDQRFKISFWMMRYETFLFSTAPESTYERYTRALDKLFVFLPEKKFLHEFRRADFEDYKKHRLESGISAKTVNIELSIYRSFWNFLLRLEADGVMYNPVRGVRVQMPSKRKNGQNNVDKLPV